jgi:DNA polymerase III subunit gamma/tau
MSDVLYRKYRPTSFDDLVGQDVIKSILLEQIRTDRISHAYLFCGPRGTGKTSVARIFAKEINGMSEIDSLDIVEIDAASNRGIDEIRELKSKIDFVPSRGKYKIYVVDEVHMLTKEAFNALLKTLEEPPSHAVFILATTEVHKVPATILSRVVRFDFRLGTREDIKQNLIRILESEGIELDYEAIDLLARHARGSYRDSLSILQKIVSSDKIERSKKLSVNEVAEILGLSNYEIVNSFIELLKESSTDEALGVLRSIEMEGHSLTQFIFEVLDNLRDRVFDLYKGTNNGSSSILTKIIRELYIAYRESKTSPIESLPYELAVIALGNNQEEKVQDNMVIKEIIKKEVPIKTNEAKMVIENEGVKDAEEPVHHEVGFDRVKADWGKLVESLKIYNHHLSAFITKSDPRRIEDGSLVVAVPYKIYKNKMDTKRSSEILSAEVKKLWGLERITVIIDAGLIKTLQKSVVDADDSNSSLVEDVFGV